MDEPLYAGAGSKAVIGAGNYNHQEIWREEDRGHAGLGGPSSTAEVYLDSFKALAAIAIAAAGTTALSLKSQYRSHDVLVTVAAGGGAYTANVTLPASVTGTDGASSVGFSLGDRVEMRIEVAASANPAFKVYHDAVSGAALLELAGEAAGARNYIASFRHDGTQWRLWDVRQVNS